MTTPTPPIRVNIDDDPQNAGWVRYIDQLAEDSGAEPGDFTETDED